MKRNPEYILTHLANTAYLLPYGQMIASQRHGIQLNETGVIIWNLLKNPMELPELLALAVDEFQIPPEQQEELQKDLEHFVFQLSAYGILEDAPAPVFEEAAYYLRIAGLTLKLCGDKAAFSEEFMPFLLPEAELSHAGACTDLTIVVSEDEPPARENGSYLLRDPQLCVYETLTHYTLLFPSSYVLKEAHLTKNGDRAVFYCTPPYDEVLVYELFHAIRIAFLYLAGRKGMYAIHSASILYRDKAWLFSGPSGTGKSTHTGLWNEYYSTPIINGDLNLLAVENGKALIHGIPWCGTSGICDTKTHELGGIVLLKQYPENRLFPLKEDEKQLLVLQRLISPLWNEPMMENMLSFIGQLSGRISTYRLGCTISKDAVDTIKYAIDTEGTDAKSY